MVSLPPALFALFAAFFPACPTEDSNRCAWLEPLTQDGRGIAFVALSDSVIIYRGQVPPNN